MNRRNFIIQSSVLSVASLSLLNCTAQKMKSLNNGRVGLQLYTVRDAMKEDAIGTLKTLAQLGYTDIESAGYHEGKYYGMSPKEFKKVIDDLGLRMLSGHTLTGANNKDQKNTMINNWEAACEDAASIGQKHIVCAYLFDFERKAIDDYKRLSDLLNKCGETSKKYGVNMMYHNHDFEFIKLNGQVPYDVMLANTNKEVVNYELDLYWTRFANVDPMKYFNEHEGRFHLWHIKDMEGSGDKFFTEVGNGVIDWKSIFNKAKKSGMQHFYVEQDICRNHKPLESVKISIDYLRKNILES